MNVYENTAARMSGGKSFTSFQLRKIAQPLIDTVVKSLTTSLWVRSSSVPPPNSHPQMPLLWILPRPTPIVKTSRLRFSIHKETSSTASLAIALLPTGRRRRTRNHHHRKHLQLHRPVLQAQAPHLHPADPQETTAAPYYACMADFLHS